jgi:hypothetical protein
MKTLLGTLIVILLTGCEESAEPVSADENLTYTKPAQPKGYIETH